MGPSIIQRLSMLKHIHSSETMQLSPYGEKKRRFCRGTEIRALDRHESFLGSNPSGLPTPTLCLGIHFLSELISLIDYCPCAWFKLTKEYVCMCVNRWFQHCVAKAPTCLTTVASKSPPHLHVGLSRIHFHGIRGICGGNILSIFPCSESGRVKIVRLHLEQQGKRIFMNSGVEFIGQLIHANAHIPPPPTWTWWDDRQLCNAFSSTSAKLWLKVWQDEKECWEKATCVPMIIS